MTLFPTSDPFARGTLPVGDGHLLYWEEAGAAEGVPVVVLHGGPGEGIQPAHTRFFDPRHYRIIAFDQRGSGRSTPLGRVEANSPAHLVEDMERLRSALGIGRWLVFGGSWGATLAWLYARAHPGACLGVILRGFASCDAAEMDWLFAGMSSFNFPGWSRISRLARSGDPAEIVAAFDRVFAGGDQARTLRHARALHSYIDPCATVTGAMRPFDPARLPMYRIFLHYCRNHLLPTDWFLDGPQDLAHVPGIVVQGALDLVTPPRNAIRLAQRWPGLKLRLVPGGGHASMVPPMADALVQATKRVLCGYLS